MRSLYRLTFGRSHRPRRDMVLVALAGPGSNLILAFVAVRVLLNLVDSAPYITQSWLTESLMMLLFFNLILCIFNMIPIPPLDGGTSRAVGILPPAIAMQLERLERAGLGIILTVGLFLLPWLGDQVGLDLNVFMWVVAIPATELAKLYNRMWWVFSKLWVTTINSVINDFEESAGYVGMASRGVGFHA